MALHEASSLMICLVALGTGWISWFFILIWLRHVTWFGTIALSGLLALFFVCWLYLGSYILRHIEKRNVLTRAIGFAGLAGTWVVLEWLRSWFVGFPLGTALDKSVAASSCLTVLWTVPMVYLSL